MTKTKSADPFVSNEPAVEISPATNRLLKQRMKTADEGHLVPAEKARQRIQQRISKSSTVRAVERSGVADEAEAACRTEILRRVAAADAEIDRGDFVEYDASNIQELAKDVHERGLKGSRS